MDDQSILAPFLCDDREVGEQILSVAESCRCQVVPVNDTLEALDSLEDGARLFIAYFRHVQSHHLRFIQKVSQRWRDLSIVVLGDEDSAATAVDVMRAGADYYVVTTQMADRLYDALDDVANRARAQRLATAQAGDARGMDMEAPFDGLWNTLRALMQASRSAMSTLEHTPASTASGRNFWRLEPGMTMRDLERRAIEEALRECNRNRTQAASLLQISIRTLHRKIREYDLR